MATFSNWQRRDCGRDIDAINIRSEGWALAPGGADQMHGAGAIPESPLSGGAFKDQIGISAHGLRYFRINMVAAGKVDCPEHYFSQRPDFHGTIGTQVRLLLRNAA
jgi:hypothetical protein